MKGAGVICFLFGAVLSCYAAAQGSPIHYPPKANVLDASMLSPSEGWALSVPSMKLWWTTDGGGQWRQITPATQGPETILSVFFLDTQVGWALLKDDEAGSDSAQFFLASTTSGGDKWEIHRLSIPELVSRVNQSTKEVQSIPNRASGVVKGLMTFVDPLHGWIYVCPDIPDLSDTLITGDGGKTWQHANVDELHIDPESIVLVTPEIVWLNDANRLFTTQDGAKTWRAVSLPVPTKLSRWFPTPHSDEEFYSSPVFQDPKHGFEVVTYSWFSKVRWCNAVLFETLDGGGTWQAVGVLKNLPFREHPISSTVVDSTWLIPRAPMYALPMITVLHPGEWENAIEFDTYGYQYGFKMSFINSVRGWLIMDGALLSTQDGGGSWSDVTPDWPKDKPERLADAQ
jgi:photosystem II stability/assembly factor-like uncharacterized protein